ncbi:MAG TPA: transcription antitermination factor NusB [Solirubrobacterales bacterium]|nr:transcription antitermination factor NusB [Solirubrobacterales bacterium]
MSDTRAVAPQRRAAYEVLRRVFEHGAWADRAFPAAADRHRLDSRERAQAQRLAYGAVQRRGTADHLIQGLADRPLRRLDPAVLAALRLGLYELAFSDATPDHAAVDQAVELAKGGGVRRRLAGAKLVNAVLRRAASSDDLLAGLDDRTPQGAAALHSCPEWLARMWWDELGAEVARSLLAAINEPAETAVRVNTLKVQPQELVDGLLASGETVERPGSGLLAPPEALVVQGHLSDGLRSRIAGGELVPQARASQAVVEALDPQPAERVLDLCAAPGIKTSAIAARMRDQGELVAVERDPGRANQLRDLCSRLGATCVKVVVGDATEVDLGDGYDRVLVDPPCSDLGTLASRPDARWRKSPELIERLAGVQGAILNRAVDALDAGGRLVYSTCTVSRREGEDRLQELLATGRAVAVDLGRASPELAHGRDSRFLQIRSDRDHTDGFFIAQLERT